VPRDEHGDLLVYVMREVFDGVPITRVVHDADGDWQYMTDSDPVPSAAMLTHQGHVLDHDPSLAELAEMPRRTWAWRPAVGKPWVVDDVPDE
jgi:hypothetical protein